MLCKMFKHWFFITLLLSCLSFSLCSIRTTSTVDTFDKGSSDDDTIVPSFFKLPKSYAELESKIHALIEEDQSILYSKLLIPTYNRNDVFRLGAILKQLSILGKDDLIYECCHLWSQYWLGSNDPQREAHRDLLQLASKKATCSVVEYFLPFLKEFHLSNNQKMEIYDELHDNCSGELTMKSHIFFLSWSALFIYNKYAALKTLNKSSLEIINAYLNAERSKPGIVYPIANMPVLTTSNGHPVDDNQHSMTAGPNGPM